MKTCIVSLLVLGLAAPACAWQTKPKVDKQPLEQESATKSVKKPVQEAIHKDAKKPPVQEAALKKDPVQQAAPKDVKKGLLQVEQGDASGKNRPVTKVINLLKDMVNQLEKEGEEDQEIYETMGCWCETNDKAKTKSISDAESKIAELSAAIEEYTATSARLNTEIGNHNTEVEENTKALDEAGKMREKELAEFTAEEKENLVTINSLKSAVITLSKHHEALPQTQKSVKSTGFLQEESNANVTIAATLHRIVRKHADMLVQSLTPTQLRSIASFVLTHQSSSLLQSMHPDAGDETIHDIYLSFKKLAKERHIKDDPPPEEAYPYTINPITGMLQGAQEPASGEIYGVLKQMKENFETNMQQAQREELKAAAEYEDLKATKEKQIETGNEQIDVKTQELAMTDEKSAEAKQDLEDTQNVLEVDTKFLADLKERCANMDNEFEERTKVRQQEIQAVSKALAFLSSDEAHDLFTRTFNPTLLQTSTTKNTRIMRRDQVVKLLQAAATKLKNPNLSLLAVRTKMNPVFDKIKKETNEMIDKLVKEKWDEIKLRDYCIDEFNTNERDQINKRRDRDEVEAKIKDLKLTIDTLAKEIEVLKAEIAELQIQLKRAGQTREKENAEFQVVVADQRATQKLLKASLGILQSFYDKAALVQTTHATSRQAQATGQAPPPGFRSYEKSSSSGGVMGMMEGIIDEAKAMETEALRAEETAQKDYEDFTQETNESIEQKNKEITNKTEAKAKAEMDLVQAEKEMEATLTAIESLENDEHDLHGECDFVLKNFESTQSARDAEIESLKQAVRIFSGASFEEFLQVSGLN